MTPITYEHRYRATAFYFCPWNRRVVAVVWNDSKRPGNLNCCYYCNDLQRDEDGDDDTPAPNRAEVEG